MAIVKLGGIVTEISGKIGGQSFSNYGNFATLKNITQRNTLPSSKQARQRFITGQISGSWGQLTQAQRDGWETASINYTYYNKIGVQVTRNGFQTFNFLNQNLTLIGIAPNVNAPAYVPVTQPKINIIDISSGNFEIQSNNSSATYLYALFAAPNLPNGVSYAQNRMKYCGTITSAQLNAGYDVIAAVEAVFGNLAFPNKISIIIDPINQTTGNRSQYVTEILNIDTPMIIEVTVADGNSITIPFVSGGTYLGSVDFGDGTVNTFNAWNSAGLTHTYTNGGVYLITISGAFPKFSVNNGAFKAYLSDVRQFGTNKFTVLNFYGATLLVNVTAIDTPTFASGIVLNTLFRGCLNLLTFNNINYWDVSLNTTLVLAFTDCPIACDLSLWVTTLNTSLSNTFNNSDNVVGYQNWDVGLVTNLQNGFKNNSNVQDCSGWNITNALTNMIETFVSSNMNWSLATWDTSNVNNMNQAFRFVNYNVSLASNNFSSVTNMTLFFQSNNSFSTANYDALLQKIVADGPQMGVTAGFTNAKYTGAGAGGAARATLIATYGWTITDGGAV
jgi:hypothetical protein